jgi:hypothetical protein
VAFIFYANPAFRLAVGFNDATGPGLGHGFNPSPGHGKEQKV